MPNKPATQQQLLAENDDLRARLAQAESALREMRSDEVDALFVSDVGGVQLFAPANADQSFRILVGEMSEGALTMTAEGVIVYANRHFARMLKTPLEKLIGSTVRTWLATDSQPILQSLLSKGAGEERHGEVVLAASDATAIPVHLSVSNLPIKGQPDAYCLVVFDLTEHNRAEAIAASERMARELLAAANQSRAELLRVIEDKTQAEVALRMAEQQQRQLVENLEIERSRLVAAQRVGKIGSWEMTLATTALHWSEETHRIHETDPATFHPNRQSYLQLIHPEDRARVDEAFERSLAAGAVSAIEHRVLMPDQRIKFLEEHWQVVSDTQGVPIRAVGTCQDITERKRMEAALRESEADFRILAEAMPQIVWIARADGWHIYFNQHWMDYTGLTLEESVGHGWNKPFHPDDRQRALDAWQQATQTIGTYSIESRLRRADGVYRWWLVRGVPLKGANGEILKWFGTCTDIHDLKVAELEIARYVEQLQTAVMSTVEVATTLSEMRDPYTAGHERRVAEIAVAIGTELGFDVRRLAGLRVAGQLHDVGKITIPSEILSKPGKISAIEFQLIQGHAQAGFDVLKGVEFPWPVAQVALQHHERMDGSGYPQGLKGEAILLEARIMAVADVVEAMSSHRPYRPALGMEAALAEIKRGRGTVYDPVVADACLKLYEAKAWGSQ